MTPLAQFLGLAGLLATCLWSFMPSRRLMILVQMAGSVCFAFHWGLSGNWTAMWLGTMMLGIAALSLFMDGPADSPRMRLLRRAYLLALLPVGAATLLTWAGPQSVFAAIGTAVGCWGRYETDMHRHRNILLLAALPWLVHNLMVGSLAGILADVFGLGRAAWLRWGDRLRIALPVPLRA